MSLQEKILLRLSRKPGSKEYGGATANYTVDNALDFPLKTVPRFIEYIQGKRVLDFGCGPGYQAVAMVKRGADSVLGLDINSAWLSQAEALAEKNGCSDKVTFRDAKEFLAEESGLSNFDVTLSCGSFEHFADPAQELENMKRLTRNGGRILITFAEPWLSPHGSHMYSFCKVPYVNILFSEKTVLAVRARFRDDGAERYEDIRSGLNRMTLARFERIIRNSGLQIAEKYYFAVKGLPVVKRIPYLRDFFVSAVSCVLVK